MRNSRACIFSGLVDCAKESLAFWDRKSHAGCSYPNVRLHSEGHKLHSCWICQPRHASDRKGLRRLINNGVRKLYLKRADLWKASFWCEEGPFLSPWPEWEDQQPHCSHLGGKPSVGGAGTSHEKAALSHGARAVHLAPVPVHLAAGVAPVHPHLRPAGGLLQRARPRGGRLD